MARLLIACVLLAATAPLLAQPAPPVTPQPQPMTRADVQARVQAQFAKRDADRDGFLTKEEIDAGHTAMKDRWQKSGIGHVSNVERGDPNAAFDRLDANRDGSISRDEFASARQVRIEKRVIVDGQHQPGARHGMRHGGGGMMGAAMLRMADTDRDGRVSLAEATAGALRHFDMIDANRDGRITPEERAAGRIHIRQMRGAG